ncbi:MAG TPA: MIP/aquaporin family protein [Myxococcota bacterium]|jgi:glycerol uptake facilitator-like aquaporin
MESSTLPRRCVAELLGTAFLLAAVVGSGIMGERLSGGNVAIALLANSIATGCALVALLLAFGPISGAQLNPAVTLVAAWNRQLPWHEVAPYVASQAIGAFAGVAVANAMFDLPVFFASTHARTGGAQLLSEGIATFGLISIIAGSSRRPAGVPAAVGAYIAAAYWFTGSTSFANPVVTLARSASDTFAGIRPADVPAFVAMQGIGAALAALLWRWLAAPERRAS